MLKVFRITSAKIFIMTNVEIFRMTSVTNILNEKCCKHFFVIAITCSVTLQKYSFVKNNGFNLFGVTCTIEGSSFAYKYSQETGGRVREHIPLPMHC